MAALDYKTELDTAFWTLLEANAVVAAGVKPGSRVKQNVDAQARARIHRAPADYPQLRVTIPGGARMGRRATLTFAANLTAATVASMGDPVVPATQDVLVALVHDKTRLGDQAPLEAAIKQALYTKYPKLNLSYVTDFTISEPVRKDVADDKLTGGVERTILLMLVTVSMRLRLSQLVG